MGKSSEYKKSNIPTLEQCFNDEKLRKAEINKLEKWWRNYVLSNLEDSYITFKDGTKKKCPGYKHFPNIIETIN